jgi:hypothetical protein
LGGQDRIAGLTICQAGLPVGGVGDLAGGGRIEEEFDPRFGVAECVNEYETTNF